MTPGHAPWDLWDMATKDHRNVNLVRLDDVDARGFALESQSQSAKGPSAGGDMTAHSSSDGRARSLPPSWTPDVAAEQCAGAMSASAVEDQKCDQI